MLLSYIFGPSVVKYDIVSNNRRSMLHAVMDLDCLFFSICRSDFLLSFWTYSAKSPLILAEIFSTHLFLNSPTKSCNPIRAMTTRKKRNKTKTSLSSFRERSNVLTIARRPETSNKSFIYHHLPLTLSFQLNKHHIKSPKYVSGNLDFSLDIAISRNISNRRKSKKMVWTQE